MGVAAGITLMASSALAGATAPERTASKAPVMSTSNVEVGSVRLTSTMLQAARPAGMAFSSVAVPAGVDGGCVGTPEGEPCVLPVPSSDTFNGGCNSPSQSDFSSISLGETVCGQAVSDSSFRDTDWYVVSIPAPGNYAMTVQSSGPVVFGFIGDAIGPVVNPTCGTISQINPFLAGAGTVVANLTTAGTYWLFVGDDFTGTTCYEYTLTIGDAALLSGACCLEGDCIDAQNLLDCTALGGIFQGDGVDCSSVTCPQEYCGGPGSGDCCVASSTPYCEDSDCCSTVCAIDPYCCDTAWDSICASEAQDMCAICNIPAACCFPGAVCEMYSEADCTGFGGIFQGSGSDCGSTTCPDVSAPANNECYEAQAFTASDVNGASIDGTNTFASPEFGLPTCGGPLSGPAVWYTYDGNTLGSQTITVSLCDTAGLPAGSRLSDSVLNVYSNTIPDFCLGTFCCVAGNDDSCGLYSSVTLCAGEDVYFFLVSGYAGATGDFLINITGDGVACGGSGELCVSCQPGDVAEGEPCPTGADVFNGGCNSTPNVFSTLSLDTWVCGTADATGGTRDTDWYQISIPVAGTYDVVLEAAFDAAAGFIGDANGPVLNPTCATISQINPFMTPAACSQGVVTAELQAGTYWVFVGPSVFEGVNCPDSEGCPGTGRYRVMVRTGVPIIPCVVDCPAGAVAECGECVDQGGSASSSTCCFASGGMGCDDAECTSLICGMDPFCCDVMWDDICAGEAIDLCAVCQSSEPVADDCNGGCNNVGDVLFQDIACGDTVCGSISAGNSNRDTDWYVIEVTNPEGATITATLEAEFPGVVFIVDAPTCDAISLLGTTGYSSCSPEGVITNVPAVATVGPGTYVVFVSSGNPDGSGIFAGVNCGVNSNYVLTVTGDCGGASCSCSADLTGDCVVNADDLGVLLGNMGCTGSCAADLNGDGIVNADDLGILLGNLGCAG
jgi:hypothetical protein